MSAVLKIKEMLKEIHEAGDVNAMRIWKGHDNEGNYGWCYQWFGRSEIHYMGKSVTEAREYVDEELQFREATTDPDEGAEAESNMDWDRRVVEYERSIGLRD